MKEMITRQTVVDKLGGYLQLELPLTGLVAWAETALMEGQFETKPLEEIRDLVARLGVANGRAFGLIREYGEQLLNQLGYSAHINIEASEQRSIHKLFRPPLAVVRNLFPKRNGWIQIEVAPPNDSTICHRLNHKDLPKSIP